MIVNPNCNYLAISNPDRRSDISIRSFDNRAISYFSNVEKNLHIKEIPLLDVDSDSLNEILYLVPYSNSSFGTPQESLDSVMVKYFDLITGSKLVFTARRPDRLALSSSRKKWVPSIYPLLDFSTLNSVKSDSCFYIVEEGTGDDYYNRKLHAFGKFTPPTLTKTLKLPNARIVAASYIDEQSKHHIILSGSNYHNAVGVPIKYKNPHGKISSDTLTDTKSNIIQLDENLNIEWITQLEGGGGNTVTYFDNDAENILVVYNQRNFIQSKPASALYAKLNPQNGTIKDSISLSGTASYLKGPGISDSIWIGLQYSRDCSKVRLFSANQRFSDFINLPSGIAPWYEYTPALLHPKYGYLFFLKYKQNKTLIIDERGKYFGKVNGIIYYWPREIQCGSDSSQFAFTTMNRNEQVLYQIEANPFKLWYFWRMRWLLMMLSGPVLLSAGYYYFNKYVRERRKNASLLKASNELLEKQVRIKTNHLNAILDNTSDAIVTVNKEMKVTKTNKIFNKLFEVEDPSVETIGKKINAIVKENFHPLIYNAFMNENGIKERLINLNELEKIVKVKGTFLKHNSVVDHEIMLIITDVTELYRHYNFAAIRNYSDSVIGQSDKMKEVFFLVEKLSSTLSNVLITGESGTGKELIANLIHNTSSRSSLTFLKVNCTSLPPQLIESELFGHVKGAFTGAYKDRIGRFEEANNGTIFLDEIGDLPLPLQTKLLRVLQEGEFQRVGENKTIKSDARIIAATNQDIAKKALEGTFRQDLFYRLNVVNIHLSPLRERQEDILPLTDYFCTTLSKELGKIAPSINEEVSILLLKYNWPGNVRELKNTIHHALILCSSDEILPNHLPPEFLKSISISPVIHENGFSPSVSQKHNKFSREDLLRVLDDTEGNITRCSQILHVSRVTIYRKMKEWGIDR